MIAILQSLETNSQSVPAKNLDKNLRSSIFVVVSVVAVAAVFAVVVAVVATMFAVVIVVAAAAAAAAAVCLVRYAWEDVKVCFFILRRDHW